MKSSSLRLNWLDSFGRSRASSEEWKLDNMSALWTAYKIGIDVLNSRVNRRKVEDSQDQSIDPIIDKLLEVESNSPLTFERLYEAEQRLVAHMTDEDIVADSTRRFVEAQRLGVLSAEELKKQFGGATTLEARRSCFLVLLDDLHFRYQKRTLDRRVRKIRAQQMNMLGLALIVPTALIIILSFAFENLELLAKFHMIAVLWFGLIGAFMSRMIAFQRVLSIIDYDSLVTDFSFWSTLVRLIIGTLGALMMYFLIIGGIVGGELFPKWSEGELIGKIFVTKPNGTVTSPLVPAMDVLSKEFAKLLIWSTIAGFSERLIPDRFAAMELASTQSSKSS